MNLKTVKGLDKHQKQALKSYRNGWGRLWKKELERFYKTGIQSLDALYVSNEAVLKSTETVVKPILSALTIEYSGPDRD